MMDANMIYQMVGSLGFPIVVAIWFMVKSSKDTQQICNCLYELKEAINILKAGIGGKE